MKPSVVNNLIQDTSEYISHEDKDQVAKSKQGQSSRAPTL